MNIPISYWSKPVSFYCEAHNEILGRMSKLHFPQWKWFILPRSKKNKKHHTKDFCWSLKWAKPVPHHKRLMTLSQPCVCTSNEHITCMIYPNMHTHTHTLPWGQGLRCSPSRHKAGPSFQISLTHSSVHLQKAALRVLRSVQIWGVL